MTRRGLDAAIRLTDGAGLLVLTSDPQVLTAAKKAATHRGLDVITVGSDQARTILRAGRASGALVDGELGGAPDLMRALRQDAGPNLPLIAVCRSPTLEKRVAAVDAGASLLVAKPVDAQELEIALGKMGSSDDNVQGHVLVIDDDADFGAMISSLLDACGIDATCVSDPRRSWEALEETRPDLVLVDVRMPVISGFDFCRALRASPNWRDVPVLFVTAAADPATRKACFDAGADDYLSKPIVESELLARIRVRLERTRALREQAERDPLTGLYTRRAFERIARQHLERSRGSAPVAVALLDLDHFKSVNDTHGHPMGDQVLKALAAASTRQLRAEDAKARWGGEEFVILLPDTTPNLAQSAMARVLEDFRRQVFDGRFSFRATFSAGVGSMPLDGFTLESLLTAADRRLYRAKAMGRDTIEISGGNRISLIPPPNRGTP